jgi:fatty-acyl-CoA synthase
MLENAWQTGRRLGIGSGDRYTSIIPLFHCAGCIMGVLMSLQNGATYVGVAGFDPETMFRVIQDERCTAMSGVPTSYLAMLDHPARQNYDLSSLRTGTCGGADCNAEVLRACAAAFPMPELVQVYGQTESSTLIAMADHSDADRVSDAGLPLEGYELRITDPENGDVLPPGSIGHIEARGSMTMLGYHEDPVATGETLTADGWLRTGDLGFLSESGRLTIAGGRLRDMIIRGGENIYPVEVENTLREHPAIAEASVFGVPDPYYGEVVAAALRLTGPVRSDELVAHCQTRIARYKTPSRWLVTDNFPLTSSGKIRKVELREWVGEGRIQDLP